MDKNNKPLSPHLTIYKPQITSVMSISHRIFGVFQSFGNLIIFVYFIVAVCDLSFYNTINLLMNSILGKIFIFFYILSICYHLCNGIRHLMWDLGYGFEIKNVYYTGYTTIFSSILLVLMVWFL